MIKIRNNSKKIVFMLLAVIGLVTILVTSYSFINTNLLSNRKFVITSGLLELTMEENDGVTLSDALPVYDEVGMLGRPHTFTLTNNSKFSLNYNLLLVDETEGEELLAYDDIRYGLSKEGVTVFGSIADLDNMIIDTGTIASTRTVEYEFRMWINHTVTDESRINGKTRTFRFTIKTTKSGDDIILAATLDGEAITEFPTIEDNYGVESITCTDGVSASFNPTTWSVTVDGVTKSNTSCIVNFSSDITINQTDEAITMSKNELYAFYKGSFASTATSSEILSGKTVYLNGVETVGTMANNGSVNATINAGESYTIPKGYHDGTGVITSNDLASQTVGTATATDILSGKTAWINGELVTGIAKLAPTSQTGSYWTKAGYADYTYYTVNFPEPFASTPTVTLSSNTFNCTVSSVSTTGFTFGARRKTSGNTTSDTVYWSASA